MTDQTRRNQEPYSPDKVAKSNKSEMSDWKFAITDEWNKREELRKREIHFPLIARNFDSREIIAGVDCLLSGQLTMAGKVREFEIAFAKFIGAKYAVMVNSGSSANLLAFAVATNPLRKNYLKAGDEVLVPTVCWSTSLWPIIQLGLKPVFVDSDPETLNIDISDARKKMTSATRGMIAVHILGNSAPMKELIAFAQEHQLLLIEDTCESLGASAEGQFLGTFGEFGTFSFYYSHHMTTGEGGMVVCKTLEDYDLLKCLRAHGWSRELSNRSELEKENPEVDPRFLFVNLGYNLRPMEIQATFGLCQLDRLTQMNENRNRNHQNLSKALQCHPRWQNQFSFPAQPVGTQAVWFGFPLLLQTRYAHFRSQFQDYLSQNQVENRPIVSGNMTRQPALNLLNLSFDAKNYPGAEQIHHAGIFIGLHTEILSPVLIDTLSDILLGYEFKN